MTQLASALPLRRHKSGCSNDTNPKLRQVKLKSGRTVVAERIGDQHYLIWGAGKALTEVRCVPPGTDRWYARGSQLNWARSRIEAIQNGIYRAVKGVQLNGMPLEAWSVEARAAMRPNTK